MTGDSDSDRQRAIRRVLLGVMVLNLLVAAAKAFYGVVSGSLAVTSDSLHSLVDAGANVVGLVVMKLSAAPPDEGHPYGHHKLEIIASAVIGVAVGFAAIRFAYEAILALARGPVAPHVSTAGFVIIGGTWIVNIAITTYETRRAKTLNSPLLGADAAHTASDVFVTAVVLVALAAARFGFAWADPVGTLVVVVVVGRIAWQIIRSNLDLLIDRAIVDAARVRAVAERHPEVRQCHRVRSRGIEGAAHVDLHLLLDGNMTLRRAHEIAHQVEDDLRASMPEIKDVVIHTEPEEVGSEGL